MPVYDQSYGHWDGEFRRTHFRWLPMVRFHVSQLLKKRMVWLMLFLSFIPAIGSSIPIYIAANQSGDSTIALTREIGLLLESAGILEEADSMAERVMVVDHGRLIADGTAESLKEQLAGDLITITARSAAEAGLAATHAETIAGAHAVEVDGTAVRFRVDRGPSVLPEFLRGLDAQGLPAQTAEVRRPTLDDVFLALTGRSLREGAPVESTDQPDRPTEVEVA